MKKRKWLRFAGIVCGILLLCVIGIGAALGIMSAKGYGISTGWFYDDETRALLVGANEAMVMSDRSKGQNLFSNLSTGDFILVVHDGVNETYPAQTGAYYIFRISKGDESDLPEQLNLGKEVINYEAIFDKPTVTAEYSRDYANISLKIPEGWEYEIEENTEEYLSKEFCIAFWPEGQLEGKINVWYYTSFGVCGTGLTEEEIQLGTYQARRGTYEEDKIWSYIYFTNAPGDYVAETEGTINWWKEYGDEAMRILAAITIGDGIITEYQAIEIAKQNIDIEYDRSYAKFDSTEGIWTVTLYEKNTAGGDVQVKISAEGEVVDLTYGE